MSAAIDSISTILSPSRRLAALDITAGSVLIATVNVLGILILIFCLDKAFSKGIEIVIGVKGRNA